MSAAREHQAPRALPELCWLSDLRRYGIAAANELHPLTPEQLAQLDNEQRHH